MIGGPAGIGENSSDECCMCGDVWTEGQQGWILCDSENGCENTVCAKCATALNCSVSELFYCPICAGSGQSAAATAGGAVATAVAACAELEKLPLSFEATKKILTNLLHHPDDPKYRKLRLENKSVRQLVDLEPVLNILSSVGFVPPSPPPPLFVVCSSSSTSYTVTALPWRKTTRASDAALADPSPLGFWQLYL